MESIMKNSSFGRWGKLFLSTLSIVCVMVVNGYSQCQPVRTATTDYCQTGPTHGVFLCASTQIPSGLQCSSSCSTSTCHYIHMRNLSGCTNPTIDKIEITMQKDANSSQFQFCNVYSQWGTSPWTLEWIIKIGGANFNSSTCYNWPMGITQFVVEFTPPASGYE